MVADLSKSPPSIALGPRMTTESQQSDSHHLFGTMEVEVKHKRATSLLANSSANGSQRLNSDGNFLRLLQDHARCRTQAQPVRHSSIRQRQRTSKSPPQSNKDRSSYSTTPDGGYNRSKVQPGASRSHAENLLIRAMVFLIAGHSCRGSCTR